MDLSAKKTLVVGFAQTGIALARFLVKRGAHVTITDNKPDAELGQRKTELNLAFTAAGLDSSKVAYKLGGHTESDFTSSDLVVMSPGVPQLPAMKAASERGVPVIAEIELASRFFHKEATLIAITGTNGKSTTTALTGALCEASRRPTFCGGNLGNYPLIDAVDHPANSKGGLIVAEVAGFMLENCTSFRPKVAACLNITPDHLDRYGTLDAYAAMKTRIYQWQANSDFAIANALDSRVMQGAQAGQAAVYQFNSQSPVTQGAHLSSDRREIILSLPDRNTGNLSQEHYPVSDLAIIGTHNMENAMAAYLAARLAGVSMGEIRTGASVFSPLPHRMVFIGEKNDIRYYDDSKGTNVASVAASVTGFPRPLVLIAGGLDKGGSYDPLFSALSHVARGMVLIGQAAPIIRKAAELHNVSYPILDAGDMNDAVTKATELARPGDAVVLSPACASYDMFKNYIERGNVFRAAAVALGAKPKDDANGS